MSKELSLTDTSLFCFSFDKMAYKSSADLSIVDFLTSEFESMAFLTLIFSVTSDSN